MARWCAMTALMRIRSSSVRELLSIRTQSSLTVSGFRRYVTVAMLGDNFYYSQSDGVVEYLPDELPVMRGQLIFQCLQYFFSLYPVEYSDEPLCEVLP